MKLDNLTLLVMAAGMGSRYGGLKQMDIVGPCGETIIDYSVYDSIRAGFNKVVFIIRKDFEDQFKLKITNKYSDKIQVEFAFQDLNDLPDGFICPSKREKPWGTGHAILTASEFIREPFVAINGDDFYGLESFEVIADFYKSGRSGFSMVAFQLDKTLSEFGGVTRGLCSVKDDFLDTVIETEEIKQTPKGISSKSNIRLHGDEPVSMNVWGFTPELFIYLKSMFIEFLQQDGNELKSEYLIPSVINNLIGSGKEKVYVLRSGADWFGVTYKKDRAFVLKKIQMLIKKGIYPERLF